MAGTNGVLSVLSGVVCVNGKPRTVKETGGQFLGKMQ